MTFKFDPAEYAEMPSHLIRRDISSQVERMIDYLDSLEPDADLEVDDDFEAEETDQNENELYCGVARDYWEEMA